MIDLVLPQSSWYSLPRSRSGNVHAAIGPVSGNRFANRRRPGGCEQNRAAPQFRELLGATIGRALAHA
jgi:hypothetical protein